MVTDRAFMRAGLILVLSSSVFFGAGCSQGIGDRCVLDSDCSSGFCQPQGQSAQGGQCVATPSSSTGTGGTTGQAGPGGEAGRGGAGGEGGAAGATATDAATPSDAAQDAATTDAHAG